MNGVPLPRVRLGAQLHQGLGVYKRTAPPLESNSRVAYFNVSILRNLLSPSVITPSHMHFQPISVPFISGVPRNFVRGGSTNSVEDRGQR